MVTKLAAAAFKGLRQFTIEPKNLNLLIGANGTGKTNFADLIEFLSVLSRFGLREAIEKFDGLDEIRTKMPGSGKRPVFSVAIELGPDVSRGIKMVKYSFKLAPRKTIAVDEEELDAVLFTRSRGRPTPPAKVVFNEDKLIRLGFRRKRKNLEYWESNFVETPESFGDEQELILSAYGKLGDFRTISEYIGSMKVYNIDSMLAKSASNGNDSELERFGTNLIAFVKRVIENRKMSERLLRDLRYAVPYIKGIAPERVLSHTTLKFSERDSKLNLRAKQMSDGTIRLLGLLSVLRQPVPPPVVVVEEPENALHSHAVRMFVRVVKEVSTSRKFPIQVFLTTHSPSVLDDVLKIETTREVATQGFVAKRKDGAATIEAAPEKVLQGIAENLGRPSDFLLEGSFEDGPQQLEFLDKLGMPL